MPRYCWFGNLACKTFIIINPQGSVLAGMARLNRDWKDGPANEK